MFNKQKIVLMLTILTWCFISANAQYVSKEKFTRSVDYLNCKMVELSLTISPTKGVLDSFKKQSNCKEDPSFETIQKAINTSEKKTLDLSAEINNLKNEYKQNWTNEDVVKFLNQDVFAEPKYLILNDFYSKVEKNSKYKEDVSNFKGSLESFLGETFRTEQPDSNKGKTVFNDVSSTPKQENTYSLWDYLNPLSIIASFLALIGLIASSLYFYKEIQRLNTRLDCKANPNPQNLRDNKNEIMDLNQKLQGLERKFDKLNMLAIAGNSLSEKPKVGENLRKVDNYKTTPVKIETQPKDIYYFGPPDEHGNFDIEFKHINFEEGKSIYQLTKTSSKKASFQIVNRKEAISLALTNPEVHIKPVCNSENTSSEHRNIRTINPGEAILQDNSIWHVTDKAKIEYVN